MGLLLAELGLTWPKSLPRPQAAPPGDGAGAEAAPPGDVEAAPPAAGKPVDERTERELAALAKRADGLNARVAAAGTGHEAKVIAERQRGVAEIAATLREKLDAKDLAGAEVAFSALGARLDALETLKTAHAKHVKKRDAAKAGAVQTALRTELVPKTLADSRTRALEDREKQITAKADAGKIAEADQMVDAWIKEAAAWAKSKEAFDALRSKDPDVDDLEDLCEIPGGGAVLDSLVADLPEKTPPKAMIAATKARFGVDVEHHDRREGKGKKADSETAKKDPHLPAKDLKGLYAVLGKVPLKDVKEIEDIEHYAEETGGAEYRGTPFGDTVSLFCGRPGDKQKYLLAVPGQVVPAGEKIDPTCAPVGGQSPPAFDFVTLHEVGHAVDDAEGIMKGGRSADAGWGSPSVGDVAEKIAKATGYDEDWIESTLDSADNKPPEDKPDPPKGVSAETWEKRRKEALAWCADIRVKAQPWNNAAMAKQRSIGGIVYHESYEGDWVSYKYAARAQGISGYQFRSSFEWFAELYAAYHCEKLNPKHPAASWLSKLKRESLAG